MYERLKKLNRKLCINTNNINNGFSFFNYNKTSYKNNTLTNKTLFDKKIWNNNKLLFYPSNNLKKRELNFITLNNNINKSSKFLNNKRNDINLKSSKNIYRTNTTNEFRNTYKSNNKINRKINELKKEIKTNKSIYDYKIFDYKSKLKFDKKQNFIKNNKLKNKSFDYKKNLFINDDYLSNLTINKNSKIFHLRNFYINNNNFKTNNHNFSNNFNLTQNNKNNLFSLNYDLNKKYEKGFSFHNNNEISKQKEENSIDFNNIDNSSILDN